MSIDAGEIGLVDQHGMIAVTHAPEWAIFGLPLLQQFDPTVVRVLTSAIHIKALNMDLVYGVRYWDQARLGLVCEKAAEILKTS